MGSTATMNTATSQLLHLLLRVHLERRTQKILRVIIHPKVSCERITSRNGCRNKTKRIKLTKVMLIKKRKNLKEL